MKKYITTKLLMIMLLTITTEISVAAAMEERTDGDKNLSHLPKILRQQYKFLSAITEEVETKIPAQENLLRFNTTEAYSLKYDQGGVLKIKDAMEGNYFSGELNLNIRPLPLENSKIYEETLSTYKSDIVIYDRLTKDYLVDGPPFPLFHLYQEEPDKAPHHLEKENASQVEFYISDYKRHYAILAGLAFIGFAVWKEAE